MTRFSVLVLVTALGEQEDETVASVSLEGPDAQALMVAANHAAYACLAWHPRTTRPRTGTAPAFPGQREEQA